MAWTAPSTITAGDDLTAALWNVQVRDNLKAIGDARATWTPTVTASSGTFTTVSGAGRYLLVGKLFIWSASVTITTVGTAAGYLQFTLPVTAQASTGFIGSGRSTASTMCQVYLNTTTQARVARYDDGSIIATGTVLLSGELEVA